MKKTLQMVVALLLLVNAPLFAQDKDAIIEGLIKEATENSQLENLAHELLDVIGPRLVGTPQMEHASKWAIERYTEWGIEARKENYGTWRGWERGITHIDMISPRVQSLDGTQLAWNPSTGSKGVTAEAVTIPTFADEAAFKAWLPNVKGKLVLISMNQPTGRPDYNWEEFATEESFQKMKDNRSKMVEEWRNNIRNTGYNTRTIIAALEEAGAAGLVACNWSRGFGVNKIFSARTKNIPTVDMELEDYTMLYRLAESGHKPLLKYCTSSQIFFS